MPLPTVAGHDDSAEARIGCPGPLWARRAADAGPWCRRPALDDDERAAGDIGQWRQRLGWGDGGEGGDGVDDGIGGYFGSSLHPVANLRLLCFSSC